MWCVCMIKPELCRENIDYCPVIDKESQANGEANPQQNREISVHRGIPVLLSGETFSFQ